MTNFDIDQTFKFGQNVTLIKITKTYNCLISYFHTFCTIEERKCISMPTLNALWSLFETKTYLVNPYADLLSPEIRHSKYKQYKKK